LGDYAFIESGNQLLENLRDPADLFPGHIPIVILTTSSLHMDRKLAYEYGANCFLRKPSSFTELVFLADAIIKLWLVDNDT
jgi:DNA-binding response OmpR family regulator